MTCEMGCGKTLTTIAVMGAAYEKGVIKKALIVAPTSVVAVWQKELEQFADFPVMVQILFGDKKKRLQAITEFEPYQTKLKVLVINYECVWREDIFEALWEYNSDIIICDESQRIKTHDAKQSKAMQKLGDRAKYKIILTGTPLQNNVMDFFSQYRFLDRTVFGDNYFAFREKYAIMGGFNEKQIVGYKNLEELIKKEHSIAFRITKEEALDLPEQTFETRYIIMTEKERKIYDALRRDSYLELEHGDHITTTTILTKLLRLQQLTGGFLMKDGEDKPEQIGTAKLDALKDIIEDYVMDAKKKLVVFARFRAEIESIAKLLEKKKIPFGKIYGDVKREDRGNIVEDFQTNPETLVFLAQIDTAGLGITLTAANTCVYYSVNFNYAAYSQSLARIHRIGQKNTCTYIHLIAEGTVDETIQKALAKKEDLAKTIVDEWRNYF